MCRIKIWIPLPKTQCKEIPEHFDVFLPWANNSVATPKMVACPKLASQEWHGAETKHILKH